MRSHPLPSRGGVLALQASFLRPFGSKRPLVERGRARGGVCNISNTLSAKKSSCCTDGIGLSCDAIYVTPSVQHVSFCHLGLLCKSFLARNLWFPAEKPMVSRQETFRTHAALKLQDSHMGRNP